MLKVNLEGWRYFESIVYLHWLWLDNVAHVCSRLRWLEWLETAIWSWDLDVWRHVGIRSREGSSLNTIWRQGHLQLLSLDTFYSILLLSLLVADLLSPFGINSVSWWQAVLHSLNSFLQNLLFLFFFLLQFQSLTLEHRQL